MSKKNRRKRRRVQYSPAEVMLRILNSQLLYRVVEAVFGSDTPVHASDIARKLGISIGYASDLLRKLEKRNVLKAERDPVNGKLMFSPSNKKVTELLAEELRKRKAKELEESISQRKVAVEL